MSSVTTAHVTEDVQAAAADLTLATRRLMLAAATTAFDAEELRAATRTMDILADRLATESRGCILRAPFEGPSTTRATGSVVPWRTFAYNPQAFPLDIHFDHDTAWAHTKANALYEGPPGCVHGGFLAHLLDSILGTLVQAQGLRGVTATLDLRYLEPTPLDVPLELRARIVETTGRRNVAEAWVEHAGARTVEARGLFIDIGGARS